MPQRLDDAGLRDAVATLDHWDVVDGKLHRCFRFEDFATAFAFMTAAAIAAEKMDHHPEWRNVYNRVDVDLVTHSASGITELDIELARRMNELAGD